MKKYKRWILILTALTVFVVVQVDSLRATSLIHAGKFSKLLNTSSTTSTTASPSSEAPSNDRLRELLDEVPEDEEGVIDVNGTKITLTGIPQIDYVWDPNLPRELNGFNLSSYPFLDSMPADEDIGFDCEDKINGFYASIKFGCQLYHHCLYGVRSDFICANFTAFDQKTFICHFVSEVDCKNSYKYWSRNDDLYKATTAKSTTTSSTLVPLIDRGFYNRTRHSFLNSGSQSNNNNNNNNNSPSSQTNSDTEKSSSSNRDAPLSNNNSNRNNNNNNSNNRNNDNVNDDYNGGRPHRPLRRPPYRRRPADYYYYDDDYEEDFYERRRNRPRNRRPIYDDYDRRPLETKTPDSKAGVGKPERRPYFEDYDDYEYERRPVRNRNRSESRNNGGRYEDRRAGNGEIRRRPAYDDDRRRASDRRQQPNDDRIRGGYSEERRFSDDDRRDRFDDNRNYNGRRNNPIDENKRKLSEVGERKQNTEETEAKAAKTTTFVRPPPRVSRPVPLSEKNKFAYKASEAPNSNVRDETKGKYDDEYNDYEDDILVSSSTSTTAPSTAKAFSYPKPKAASSLSTTAKTTTTPAIDEITEVEYVYEDEYEDPPTQKPIIETSTSSIKPKYDRDTFFGNRVPSSSTVAPKLTTTTSVTPTTTATTVASSPDSFRLNRYTSNNSKENIQQQTYVDPLVKKPSIPSIIPNGNANKKFANKQTVFDAVTQETPIKFNNFQTAYNNRNLESKQSIESINESKEQQPQKMTVKVYKRPFLPSRGGEPYKARGLQPVGILAEQQQRQSEENVNRKQPETHKLTLEDLYNEEYDVDLNDALNPMLKPLTSSRNVHGYPSQTSNADPQRSETQRISSKVDHVAAKPTQLSSKTTSAQPEYYDDELEYAYDDEA